MHRARSSPSGMSPASNRHPAGLLLVLLLFGWPCVAQADGPARWLSAIAESPFAEPVAVTSTLTEDLVAGAVHARLPYPVAEVAPNLAELASWCEIIFLHMNIKTCVYRDDAGPEDGSLTLYMGSKHYQEPYDADVFDLARRVTWSEEGPLRIELEGDRGPYGTRDYSIVVHVVPHDDETLVNFEFSLRFGALARFASRIYLSTAGRHRVGFTVTGHENDQPQFIRGMEGMIERNVMRFYLALEAWLDTRNRPEQEQPMARLQRWFELTENYPRQLRELDQETYLGQKMREYANQQAFQDGPPPDHRIFLD